LQEWKLGQTNWGEDEIREAETRADRLASMLRLDKKPVKLRCLDLVAYSIADGGGGDHKRLDFCFLYRYPPSASSTVEPLTLKQVMLLSEARKPTLSQRFRIATMLAESILELHSSKWLHKAVCSSNVLFFSDAQSGHVDFSTPHIAGFEFSRPDTVEDQTLDQFQGLCFDIYCHPDLVRVLEGREASNRPRYQRQYDIYGLGVILLEVGCWMPLKKQIDLTRAKMGRSRHEEIMIMLATLPSRMGNKYRDVVHSCLTWGSDAEKNSTEGGNNRTGNIETFNEGWKNQVEEFGYKIVHVLRECHCQM
jgi:serine/threonine protein kinase